MAFKRNINLHPNQLDSNTQLRLKEVELANMIYILARTEQDAPKKLIEMIAKHHSADTKHKMYLAFSSYPFQNPTTKETVQYFRYKNLSVHKIRKYINVPTNTLVQGGKYAFVPQFVPVFQYWNQLQDVLIAWDGLKQYYNLFKDIVIHELPPHEHGEYTQLQPNEEETEEEELNPFELAAKQQEEFYTLTKAKPYNVLDDDPDYVDPMRYFDDDYNPEEDK